MKRNSHLSLEERLQITVLQGKGISVRKIAKELGRSPSTISRELNRENALYYRGTYIGSQTHNRVKEAWQNSHKRENKFLNQRNVSYFIECQLKYGNTPEIICHLLKERFQESVSHETLYIYIYSPKRNLKQYLLRRKTGRLPKKKARLYYKGSGKNIPNRIDIDLRDKLANDRLEFGHFEADSVESCRTRGKRKSCLTVMVDRATRYTIIRKTASLTSIQTAKSIVKAMKPLSNNIKSITYLLLIGIVQELLKREEEILIMVIKKHLQQVKHPQVILYTANLTQYKKKQFNILTSYRLQQEVKRKTIL